MYTLFFFVVVEYMFSFKNLVGAFCFDCEVFLIMAVNG